MRRLARIGSFGFLLFFLFLKPLEADSITDDVIFLEKSLKRYFTNIIDRSNFHIDSERRQISMIINYGKGKLVNREEARLTAFEYCVALSLDNRLSNSWEVISFSFEDQRNPAANCLIMKYNGPGFSNSTIEHMVPSPKLLDEGKKMRALIMENRSQDIAYHSWATVGDDTLTFDVWTRTLRRLYVDPRSLAWVLRDAAAVCDKLNSSGIASVPWKLHTRIAPRLDPVASCEVSPTGGTPLIPAPPPLAPDEPSAAVEIDAWQFERLIDVEYSYPGSLAAVRAAFASYRFQVDRSRRRIAFFFDGIHDAADTRYFFDHLVCNYGIELRDGGAVKLAWDFDAYAPPNQSSFATCHIPGKG